MSENFGNIDRRHFVGLMTLGVASVTTGGCGSILDVFGSDAPRLDARVRSPSRSLAPGRHALDFGDDRDGFLFVPSAAGVAPVPLLVMFHGATGASSNFYSLTGQAEGTGFAMLATDSRGQSWDWHSGYGPDLHFLDRALDFTFDRVSIAAEHVAVGGFSDGATYSLTIGINNGDLFQNAIAFSPATYFAEDPHGKPRIFVAHGSADTVIPVSASRDVFVPRLRNAGYDVTYDEHQSGHSIPTYTFRHAIDWWAPTS
jgi:phospholipase/carboxylesterase